MPQHEAEAIAPRVLGRRLQEARKGPRADAARGRRVAGGSPDDDHRAGEGRPANPAGRAYPVGEPLRAGG